MRVLFDSGAPLSIMSLRAAKRAGIASNHMDFKGRLHGAGRGDTEDWTAAMATFELSGERILNSRIDVADFDLPSADMLLGIDFFLSHRIYVSKRQRRMYFTYNGGTVFGPGNAAASGIPDTHLPEASDAEAPTDADGYARRGTAYAARGDNLRALADLDRACELAPDTARHYTQRSRIHLALKQRTAALNDVDTALRLDPDDADARIRRAWLRNDIGERDGAIDDLQALDKLLATGAPPPRHGAT